MSRFVSTNDEAIERFFRVIACVFCAGLGVGLFLGWMFL